MVLFFLLKPILGAALLCLHRFQAFAGGRVTPPRFRTMEQSALLWNGGL